MKPDLSNYQHGQLFIENVNLIDIAEQWGTPTYIYSKAGIVDAYRRFVSQWQDVNHTVCYSVKANSNLSILRLLAEQGSGFDIVSGGELERVLRAGGHADKTVFSGVGKTATEIHAALDAGIMCFNVESGGELSLIEKIASKRGDIAPISIRFNPDVDPKTHPYIATGLKNNKFGVNRSDALALYRIANDSPHLDVKGIDCHIGSQITEISPFLSAVERIAELAADLEKEGIAITHLDLGGGLGVRYENESEIDVEAYAGAIRQALGKRLDDTHLIFEPGRFIAANAGWLLTRVLYIKNNEDKHFAVVDAAMNDLLRPALYQSWQSVFPVNEKSEAKAREMDLVGPVCESADYLARSRRLALEDNELVAIGSVGAYGFVMSSNYNSRNRAAEILIDGDKATCIRKRETIEDQLRLEL